MYTLEGHHMSDAWYFVEGDSVHMFHISTKMPPQDPSQEEHRGPFFGHAVSKDLIHWQTLPPMIQQGPSGSWDDRQLLTGSVLKRQGRYWLAYGATSSVDSPQNNTFRIQRGGMAVSDDLITWQKIEQNPVTIAGPPHYEQVSGAQREMAHWRDPFMFVDGDFVYQYICARRPDGDIRIRGTVAVTRSRDMVNWQVLPPLEHDRVAEEMEVPQIYQINGRWYLVFATLGSFFHPDIAARFKGQLPQRSQFSMVGDSPFGPFHLHGTGQIVQHDLEERFYAGQLVQFKDRWYLLVTHHDEHGERISDPMPIVADETGVHAER